MHTFGPNGLLARRINGATTFYTFDPSGNTAQRVNSSGGVIGNGSVDAFGAVTTTDGTVEPYGGFGAQWGYYFDAQTQLYLLGHRYYDPATGRFLTRDPMGYEGGINLYEYTDNNPVNNTDPTGFITEREQNDLIKLAEDCGFTTRRGGRGHIVISKPGASCKPIPGVHGPGKDQGAAASVRKCIKANCDSKSKPCPEPVPVPVPIRKPKPVPIVPIIPVPAPGPFPVGPVEPVPVEPLPFPIEPIPFPFPL